MITLNTDICKLFGIELPIVQAGMAGGATTVDLIAAVSEAGALGTLGAAYMPPEAIRKAVGEIRGKTIKPFAVNLFAERSRDDFSRLEEVQRVLSPVREELKLGDWEPAAPSADWHDEQLSVCLEMNVPVISTAFGCLSAEHIEKAKHKGIKLVAMVTTVAEAAEAEKAGMDAVVAQGSEAGGHRSTFSLDAHPEGAQIGTISLVPQVVDHVSIPVIAAGGIADGRGLVAALALGAAGVQIGTRFLTATEAGIHPLYKQAIFYSTEESTCVTKAFSGRPARGIRNRFIKEFEAAGVKPLPFPSQNTLTKQIRSAAGKQDNPEFMSLWAGQTTRMLTKEEPAEVIIRKTMEEARLILL